MDRIAIEPLRHPNVPDTPVELPDVIDLSGHPSWALFAVEKSESSPTRDEVVANDRSRAGSVTWRSVSALLPDLVDADPLAVLTAMQDRLSCEPTEENSALLQAAINQIVVSPELRRLHSDAVEQAKQVFHGAADAKASSIADNIWYQAYTEPNFDGRGFFTSMTPNWGYWRQPDFRNVRSVYSSAVTAQDVISSVQFGSSANEIGGQVIFFEHPQYGGRYRNFLVPRGGRQDVPWIGADFNDMASSALIVRHFANELEPILVTPYLRPRIPPVSSFSEGLPFPGALTADGDPIFTWDMWPSGGPGHPNAVDKIFIEIIVPMKLHAHVKIGHVPRDLDYRIEARYWIYPFVRDGKLAASVDYAGRYVEGSMFVSTVADMLESRIYDAVPGIQNDINSAMALFATALPPLSFCYLLPGRNDQRGSVRDDVTLVCVRS